MFLQEGQEATDSGSITVLQAPFFDVRFACGEEGVEMSFWPILRVSQKFVDGVDSWSGVSMNGEMKVIEGCITAIILKVVWGQGLRLSSILAHGG